MAKPTLQLGQTVQIFGLASYFGIVTKINRKSYVIEHNLSGRLLLMKDTFLGDKNHFWVRVAPIAMGSDLDKVAIEYIDAPYAEYLKPALAKRK